MTRKIEWERQIGRRLKLRDLHIFHTVVERGSMVKAAEQLGVSQPAVSEVVAELERTLGVRLLDRSPRGVEATDYGQVLLRRSIAVFDELKQGIRDIEFLADPTAGELRIGCAESIASGILSPIVEDFTRQYPGVELHINSIAIPTRDFPEIRNRSLDVVIARVHGPLRDEDDLHAEILFNDWSVIAAGRQTEWARRHKIDLAELADQPWVLPPASSWNAILVAEAFRLSGLPMPKLRLTTFSVHLRASMLVSGPFITALPSSILRLNPNKFAIKALPVDLPMRPWPLAVITLKNRTMSPVAQHFIEHVRAFARTFAAGAVVKQSA